MKKWLNRWWQPSIMGRVLLPMLLVFVLTVIVSAIIVRQVSLHELEEIITSNLSTSAKTMFGVLRSEIKSNDLAAIQGIVDSYSKDNLPLDNELEDELYDSEQANRRYIYLQLYVPTQKVKISSREQALIPYESERLGFFFVEEGNRRWQMYGLSDQQTGAWFFMGQRDDYWAEIHEESNEAMVTLLFLISPLLAAVIYLGLSRGLRPLRQLSQEIDQRASDNMQPLSMFNAIKETKPLLKALNDLLRRLTSAMQNERQFTADAAHELRTPIASLRAQLGVIEAARSDDERQQAVQGIDRATERMSALVCNLLALARLDSGAALPEASPYDLRHSLEGVIAEHALSAMQKNVEISLEGMLHCPLTGTVYLHELLAANLIANAIKYTPSGGQVNVYLENNGHHLCYRVEDTGPGVPEHELPLLTERFRRVRTSGGESADGAGLGLSIAARCAQLANAELHLSNRQPNGFCAEVRL